MKLICCDAAAFEQQIVGDGKNKDALQQNKNNPPPGSSTVRLPPPHTHTHTSLSRFGFMHFFCYYVLSLHFLSLMTPNWCVSHVWEQVKCVARWLCSHKSHIFTALPVDSFNHHKNKKIRHLGLKCVEESRLTYLCLLFNYTY